MCSSRASRFRACRTGPVKSTSRRSCSAHSRDKPPHVHVDRDQASCKIWLAPVALSSSLGFKAKELREIERLVSMNRAILLKAWEEFHG
ncbi:MAG: DUF4160 domain-containing protein [Synechococcus lacustris]